MNQENFPFASRLARAGIHFKAIIAEMTGRDTSKQQYGGKIQATFGMYKAISTYDISRTSYALSRAIFYANLYKDRKTGTEYGQDYLLGAPFGKPIVNIAAGFAIGSPIRIVESHSITDEEIADDLNGDPLNNAIDATGPTGPIESGPSGASGPIESGASGAVDASGATGSTYTPVDGLGNPITQTEAKPKNPTIENVNQWLEENRNFFFLLARNSFRDGDVFAAIDDDGSTTELPQEDVDIITNPNNPQLIDGYDVWSSFPDPKDPTGVKTVTYVDEIRRAYRRRVLVDQSGKRTPVAGTENDYRNASDGGLEERELPIVHFANEKEGRMLYGISEYQNLYFLMANYHAILAAAIKGNIYNSTAVPVIQGVKNMSQFLKQNFKQDKDGNYVMKWDNQKMLVVGDGGSVQILQADGTATDAQTLLNILFWLISQASETPEFAFGTAVQSSKASVSEQTPMLIKKAIRKQGQLEEPIRRLIELYIERMAVLEPNEYIADTQFSIDMPDILDEDLNINIQIVSALLEKGIITEETAMTMLNLGKYVKNFEEELAKARAQKTARSPIPTDVFGQPISDATTEAGKVAQGDNQAKLDQIAQMKANKSTKKVAEMLEKNLDALSLSQIQEMNPQFERGSEDLDPKADIVQEIQVKSGNPYRQGGGRFGSGGGVNPANGDPSGTATGVTGTAMISDKPTEAEILKLDRDAKLFNTDRDTLASGDTTMNRIQKLQGFDGAAQVVDDATFKKAAKESGLHLYRGFGNNQQMTDYAEGKLHSGHGLFGSGTYTSIQTKIAKDYGKSMLEITVTKDAKIITYNDLNKKILKTWKSYGETYDSQAGLASTQYKTINQLLNNPGRFAASLGYDVIDVQGLNNDSQVIILNRTKAIIRGGN